MPNPLIPDRGTAHRETTTVPMSTFVAVNAMWAILFLTTLGFAVFRAGAVATTRRQAESTSETISNSQPNDTSKAENRSNESIEPDDLYVDDPTVNPEDIAAPDELREIQTNTAVVVLHYKTFGGDGNIAHEAGRAMWGLSDVRRGDVVVDPETQEITIGVYAGNVDVETILQRLRDAEFQIDAMKHFPMGRGNR